MSGKTSLSRVACWACSITTESKKRRASLPAVVKIWRAGDLLQDPAADVELPPCPSSPKREFANAGIAVDIWLTRGCRAHGRAWRRIAGAWRRGGGVRSAG